MTFLAVWDHGGLLRVHVPSGGPYRSKNQFTHWTLWCAVLLFWENFLLSVVWSHPGNSWQSLDAAHPKWVYGKSESAKQRAGSSLTYLSRKHCTGPWAFQDQPHIIP